MIVGRIIGRIDVLIDVFSFRGRFHNTCTTTLGFVESGGVLRFGKSFIADAFHADNQFLSRFDRSEDVFGAVSFYDAYSLHELHDENNRQIDAYDA